MIAAIVAVMICGIVGSAHYSDAKAKEPMEPVKTFRAVEEAPAPVSVSVLEPKEPAEPAVTPMEPAPVVKMAPEAPATPNDRLKAVEEIKRVYYYPKTPQATDHQQETIE